MILSVTALDIILDPGSGLSSRLFLMEKIAVAWCPVIGLSRPNKFVLQSPFMIETVAFVLLSIREGDFLASVNLSDACFLCPIFRIQESFSRFLSDEVVSQSRPSALDCRLPLRSSPMYFCRGLCLSSVPQDSASRIPNR